MTRIKTGSEVLLQSKSEMLHGRRVGLITNQTGVTCDLQPLAMALTKIDKTRLVALFGPEHGYAGSAPDAVAVDSGEDQASALPIYSLYGKTQKPTREMLEGIEVLIFDIQDVGVRFYTYVQTMNLAMKAASEKGVRFVVLDRPNPITGTVVEGNVLDIAFSSFFGEYPIALRHGMTVGELAKLFNEHFQINADLSVVEMAGWRREMWYDHTGLVWVPPSPGMPSLGTAIVYPGTCLLEGIDVSEGRGTSMPFELIGAPWIDGARLAGRLRDMKLEGCLVRSAEFIPLASKYRGETCRGIQVHVTDRNLFEPVKFGLTVISTIRDLYSNHFGWIVDESSRRFHFDLLMGTDKVRGWLESGRSVSEILEEWNDDVIKFKEIRREFLLYQ